VVSFRDADGLTASIPLTHGMTENHSGTLPFRSAPMDQVLADGDATGALTQRLAVSYVRPDRHGVSAQYPIFPAPRPASDSPPSARRVVWLLALMGLVAYVLRTNIAIAQEYMAPELGLTMVQMGVISAWGFQLAYTIGQVPGGAMGDRHGARLVLAVASLGWAVASLASGAVSGSGLVAFAGLFAARVLLGASQAATYPVSAVAVTRHVPEAGRTAASAIYLAASTLGAALAPLTLTPLMAKAGWRAVFLASAAVGVAAAVTWYVFAPRDRPAPASPAASHGAPTLWQQAWRLLQNAGLCCRHSKKCARAAGATIAWLSATKHR
jgi:MFS family permease